MPIAVASIISKIFEKVLMYKIVDKFYTTWNRFGLKENTARVYVISYLQKRCHYNNLSLNIFYVYATKAFDRVNHSNFLTFCMKERYRN